MNRANQCWKKLCILLILVLLMVNVAPLSQSLQPLIRQSFGTNGSRDFFHFSGTMGNNGWYISSVLITIHPPEGAGPVYYKIDSGSWMEYTTPFLVDSDGTHTITAYYLIGGEEEPPVTSPPFKIDKTPPYINVTFQREGCRILVSVLAGDATSGVALVEFYFDGSQVGNCTAPPYEFTYRVSLYGEHNVTIIVYDVAGNSASASHTFPYQLSFFQSSLFQQFLRATQTIFHSLFNMIEREKK